MWEVFSYILSMDGKTFWKRAKSLIKAHNMTQKEFAEYLGISLSTLEGWIFYERVPEISMAYTISFTLGVTLNYLLGDKETNIAIARQKELEARNTAAKIVKLAEQIVKEAKGLRPLKTGKGKCALLS